MNKYIKNLPILLKGLGLHALAEKIGGE